MIDFKQQRKILEDMNKFLTLNMETIEKHYNQLLLMFKHVMETYFQVKAGDLVKLTYSGSGPDTVLVLLIEEVLQEDGLRAKARIVAADNMDAKVADRFKQGTELTYDVMEIVGLGFKIEKGTDELATLLYGKQP